ncbi:hypothetical protein K2173_020610 [Erythroxylum novogranatense]|uniref:RING-type E3 ubiquitin transferase n=1 Tax=Erythroxylum novogranatense TaxID=1862640 RepID=A0AAV8TJF3_9ROSI|nr:hypothetical protein K2173_020610 [Erythroxylum novogranatense]
MSFIFRGIRADLANGFQGFVPERRTMRAHPTRSINSNPLVFLISPNFLLWLELGIFLMATTLRMYATCQQLQAHAAMANGILGHTELRLRMQPPVVLSTRGRLQGLRLQLALLDQEFDDPDLEHNVPTTASMTDEEINAFPVHKHKVAAPQSGSAVQQASSSLSPELTCFVYLEQVNLGELIRTLPCLIHGPKDPSLQESGQGGPDASYMG